MQIPAGWYQHLDHPGHERYWDGLAWTEHLRPLGTPRSRVSSPSPIVRDGVTKQIPGFGALFELGLSDVLRTFVSGFSTYTGSSGYVLRTDGTVWKWESREVLFGNMFEQVRYVTQQVAGLEGVIQLVGDSVNGSQGFALQADGTVWGWGKALYAEVGISASDCDVPVPLPVPAKVRSLVPADPFCSTRLALTEEGEVWGWGSNSLGQVGDGTTIAAGEPQRVAGLEGITALTVGARCLALQASGDVWTWGQTLSEVLGDEQPVSDALLRPIKVEGIPPITSLFVGAATAKDGSFWMWGQDVRPSLIPGPRNVSSTDWTASSRPMALHVLTEGGTVWGWGRNEAGGVGDGTTTDRPEPVIVHGLSDVAEIVGQGPKHYALTRMGDVFAWGSDEGTYGDGGLVWDDPRPTPQRMPLPTADKAADHKWNRLVPPEPAGAAEMLPPSFFVPQGGMTYLMHYVSTGNTREVEALIQQGVDLNAVDEDGDTALYYAVSRGYRNIVDLLLKHGANPNIVGLRRNPGELGSPLEFATDKGWYTIVSSLVEHGADIDRPGMYGATPVMVAAANGHVEVLHTLLAGGADPNRLDTGGDSALYYAASRGRVDAVRVLLKWGADPNPKPGEYGLTPRSVAEMCATPGYPLPPGATSSDYAAVVTVLSAWAP